MSNDYEQAPEDLKFIVKNLDEWPSDEVSHVYIYYLRNCICFNGANTEKFDFCTKEKLHIEIGMNCGCIENTELGHYWCVNKVDSYIWDGIEHLT